MLAIYTQNPSRRHERGATLIEVCLSALIVALVFGGTIQAYIQSSQRVEWTGYSLAAQSLAQETLEQARSAIWDPAQTNQINQVTNISVIPSSISYNSSTKTWSGYLTNILDVPFSGTNYTVATNFVSIQMYNVDGVSNVWAQCIRVDCVWPFIYRRGSPCFTNTVCTIMAPDNRDPNTF
jgi:Tfp pilus assembly protein PilV